MNVQTIIEKISEVTENNDGTITVTLTKLERDILYNLLCFLREITISEQ